jgi:hypothetical protein
VNIRLRHALHVSVIAALALGVGACSSSHELVWTAASGASASPSPSPVVLAPSAALQVAIDDLKTLNYNVKTTADFGGASASGAVNTTAATAFLNYSTPIGSGRTLTIDTLETGGKVYLKLDAGSLSASMHLKPKDWNLMDLAKIHQDVYLPLDTADLSDPLDIAGLEQGFLKVERTDPTHYTGTIDMTQIGGVSSPDSSDIRKAGSKAKSVPFTATLNAKGQLVSLSIKAAKSVKALQLSIVFSSYGAPTPPPQPTAADTITAPATLYSLING